MAYELLRLPALRGRYPRCRSGVYGDIARGVMVPPVALGPRCVAWPSHEVDAIIAARIAGKSDDAIRKLVADLVSRRTATE